MSLLTHPLTSILTSSIVVFLSSHPVAAGHRSLNHHHEWVSTLTSPLYQSLAPNNDAIIPSGESKTFYTCVIHQPRDWTHYRLFFSSHSLTVPLFICYISSQKPDAILHTLRALHVRQISCHLYQRGCFGNSHLAQREKIWLKYISCGKVSFHRYVSLT